MLRTGQVFFCGAGAFLVSLFLGGSAIALELKSDAFQSGENIPAKYTCENENVLPSLTWKNPPPRTQSFTLIVDDPDAQQGTWVHWVVYDIPADTDHLGEGLPKVEILPDGSRQGITDFGTAGYGGPCPPPGKPHRYYFKLYALNTFLNLPAKQKKPELLMAMQGHILAEAQLIGKYERSGSRGKN